ncbi:MAG: hypothetical protein IT200_08315 [Thermoleophilia bacterium]|nr:hypothetical protein [Thermoleophilia bacterium]
MPTGDPILISNPNQDDAFGGPTSLLGFPKGALRTVFIVVKRNNANGSAITGQILDGNDGQGAGVWGISNNVFAGPAVRGSGGPAVEADSRAFGTPAVLAMAHPQGIAVVGEGGGTAGRLRGISVGLSAEASAGDGVGVSARAARTAVAGEGTGAASLGVSGTGRGGGVVGDCPGTAPGVTGTGPVRGVLGSSAGTGVTGEGTGGVGSVGVVALAGAGTALFARSQQGRAVTVEADTGDGVYTVARRVALVGASRESVGVLGSAFGPNPLNVRRAGVWAATDRHSGLWAQAQTGTAVEAEAPEGTAVRATTTVGVGLRVQAGTDAQGRRGLPVEVTGPPLPNGRFAEAMRIFGDVNIRGDLIVGGAKSALLAPDTGLGHRVYCVEAAEAWIEDVGEAELEDGRSVIPIDPGLRPFLETDAYQVTVTAYSPVAVHVARRDPDAFEVRSVDGTASGRFGWRLTARRADIEAPRLAPLEPLAAPGARPPAAAGPESPRRGPRPKVPARVPAAVAAPPAPVITLPRRRRMPRAGRVDGVGA